MQPEREGAPAATPPGDATHSNAVQQALEQFVELHATGEAPDAMAFAARFPEDIRPKVLAQCREFLAFDGLLGHQEWAPKPAKETQGRDFGDFVIQEELGRGGMGVVYLATQKSLHRRVALKVMASGLTLSKRHVERFRREAAAAAQLRHPAIVAVHSLTEVDGTFALAMDYVAGRNLADILDDLRLGNGDGATTVEGTLGLAKEKGYVAECAMFVADLASALAVAHAANVVHRDLKPRNLMLDDHHQVRLLDFGLAKSLGEGSISMSGEITGTAHYMSPEQTLAKRVEVDHRADIWALGVILYEMLTLRRPFDGKNLQQIVYEICFKEPVSPHKHNHKVPRDLVTICGKALEKDPQNRYQTAAEFEADLRRFLGWEPIHAKPASAMSRLGKWTRRHRTESMLAAGLLLVGIGALGVQWSHGRQADALLARAETAKTAGRFEEAFALASQACDLRNDETARARLEAYSQAGKLVEVDAAAKATRSGLLVEKDRELALLLALGAEAQHSSADTRSAVLNALGGGNVVRTLRPAKEPKGSPSVLRAAWSPDGGQVATTTHDGRIVLWEASTGIPSATLRGHEVGTWVTGVVYVGNDRLVSAGADRTLRSFRRSDASPQQQATLPGSVNTLQADRDRRTALLVTYGNNGPFLAQVWDLERLQPVSPPVEHASRIVASAISPCGRLAASSDRGRDRGRIILWNVQDGTQIALAHDGVSGRVHDLAFSADSSLLAVAHHHSARLFRVADGRLLGEARHSDAVRAVRFDRLGQRLLTGSSDCTARVWRLEPDGPDALQSREIATLVAHGMPVLSVAFSPEDQLVLTSTGTPIGGQSGTLNVFDLRDGRSGNNTPVRSYEVGPAVEWADFAPDGRAVLALASPDRAVVWDTATTAGVVTMRQPGIVPAVAFDATGTRVATAGDDERLRLWSAADGRALWTSEKLGNPLRQLDIDDSGELIAASTVNGTVSVHRLKDGHRLYALDGHRGSVNVVRFQRGSNRLLTAGAHKGEPKDTGLLLLWNCIDQSRLLERTFERPVVTADLSPDGTRLATVELDQAQVQLWALPDFTRLGTWSHHKQAITCVRFSPDGTALLTASRDDTAVLQALDGRSLQRFASKHPLHYATFARGGSHVLTCGIGSNAEAQLWRIADGIVALHFHGHRGTVFGGAFSPDSSLVATCAADGTTCIWPTDPVAVARRLPLRTLTPAELQTYELPAQPARDK